MKRAQSYIQGVSFLTVVFFSFWKPLISLILAASYVLPSFSSTFIILPCITSSSVPYCVFSFNLTYAWKFALT